jgi:excisionase family DNA binding protein
MDGEPSKKTVGLADSLDGKTRALTVADVAELVNVSERQVYKLVAEHRIPCFKIGGSIRFDPLAVALWLRMKMAPASVAYTEERQRGA